MRWLPAVNGVVAEDEDLLDEVTNLVEQPLGLLCSFPQEYLDIPAPVLISVMSKKQRYFTVLDKAPSPNLSPQGEETASCCPTSSLWQMATRWMRTRCARAMRMW